MTINKLNKLWRPYTAIATAINLFMIPLLLLAYDYTKGLPEHSHTLWIYIYGQLVFLFLGLAGIRQFDKHKKYDVLSNIEQNLIKGKNPNEYFNPYDNRDSYYYHSNRNSNNRYSSFNSYDNEMKQEELNDFKSSDFYADEPMLR